MSTFVLTNRNDKGENDKGGHWSNGFCREKKSSIRKVSCFDCISCKFIFSTVGRPVGRVGSRHPDKRELVLQVAHNSKQNVSISM